MSVTELIKNPYHKRNSAAAAGNPFRYTHQVSVNALLCMLAYGAGPGHWCLLAVVHKNRSPAASPRKWDMPRALCPLVLISSVWAEFPGGYEILKKAFLLVDE